MENEKSAVDEFLGNLNEVQDDPFENKGDIFVPKEEPIKDEVVETKVENHCHSIKTRRY